MYLTSVSFWDFRLLFSFLSYGHLNISPLHTLTAAMASFSPGSVTVTESDFVNSSVCVVLTSLPAGGALECDIDITLTPLQDTAGQKEYID